jgi:hypothetical protein
MLKVCLLYSGSILILLWGIAHLIPTKGIVKGFEDTSTDNKKIISMEWINAGIGMCFVGLLALLITAFGNINSKEADLVYLSSSTVLFIFAVVTFLTGAKTAVVPIKICPFVNLVASFLIILGSVLPV